jgi:hypothetical protein
MLCIFSKLIIITDESDLDEVEKSDKNIMLIIIKKIYVSNYSIRVLIGKN